MEKTLVNKDFITSHITREDPWCFSHGSGSDSEDLGSGMFYYGLAYALKAKTSVCLGSGGGFVPRLMRQAQRDLGLEGSRTLLVDGATKVDQERKDIWGSPCWIEEDSRFRRNYPDVDIVFDLTQNAFRDYFLPNDIQIDFLHIDADHHYDGVKLDWDLFSTLVPDQGVITLHDTVNYREPCGVYKLLEDIAEDDHYDIINFPVSYGFAIAKKKGVNANENLIAAG